MNNSMNTSIESLAHRRHNCRLERNVNSRRSHHITPRRKSIVETRRQYLEIVGRLHRTNRRRNMTYNHDAADNENLDENEHIFQNEDEYNVLRQPRITTITSAANHIIGRTNAATERRKRRVVHYVTTTDAENAATCRNLYDACRIGQINVVDQLLSSFCADSNDDFPPSSKQGNFIDWNEECRCRHHVGNVNNNLTPLHIASKKGHNDIVRLLLQKGNADPNTTNGNGYTPLILATMLGHEQVVSILLQNGADPNYHQYGCDNENDEKEEKINFSSSSNLRRKTALHWACGTGRLGIVALLLQHGADPSIREEVLGRTPFHMITIAAASLVPTKSIAITSLLLQHFDTNSRKNSNNRDDTNTVWNMIIDLDDIGNSPLSLAHNHHQLPKRRGLLRLFIREKLRMPKPSISSSAVAREGGNGEGGGKVNSSRTDGMTTPIKLSNEDDKDNKLIISSGNNNNIKSGLNITQVEISEVEKVGMIMEDKITTCVSESSDIRNNKKKDSNSIDTSNGEEMQSVRCNSEKLFNDNDNHSKGQDAKNNIIEDTLEWPGKKQLPHDAVLPSPPSTREEESKVIATSLVLSRCSSNTNDNSNMNKRSNRKMNNNDNYNSDCNRIENFTERKFEVSPSPTKTTASLAAVISNSSKDNGDENNKLIKISNDVTFYGNKFENMETYHTEEITIDSQPPLSLTISMIPEKFDNQDYNARYNSKDLTIVHTKDNSNINTTAFATCKTCNLLEEENKGCSNGIDFSPSSFSLPTLETKEDTLLSLQSRVLKVENTILQMKTQFEKELESMQKKLLQQVLIEIKMTTSSLSQKFAL